MFFAQLPKALQPFNEELLVYYLLGNAEHALPMEALQKQIDKVQTWRLKDFLEKSGASAACSACGAGRSACGRSVVTKRRP